MFPSAFRSRHRDMTSSRPPTLFAVYYSQQLDRLDWIHSKLIQINYDSSQASTSSLLYFASHQPNIARNPATTIRVDYKSASSSSGRGAAAARSSSAAYWAMRAGSTDTSGGASAGEATKSRAGFLSSYVSRQSQLPGSVPGRGRI